MQGDGHGEDAARPRGDLTILHPNHDDNQVNWKDMEFDHEEHARTGHNLLRTSEELIETLEENQVSSFAMICPQRALFETPISPRSSCRT